MGNPYMEQKEKPPKVRKFKAKKPKSGNFLSASHRRAPQQEAELAQRLGGRTTAASGAKDEKGDVRVKGIARIECKTTKNRSFSVTLDMFTKIEDAANSAGEVPVLLVEFNDGNGKKLGEVAVIPTYYLDEFVRNQKHENH